MSDTQAQSAWAGVGQSATTPTTNTKRAKVLVDSYYVVIGFEVNIPGAFKNETHDLRIDYGHAFFYLVKNSSISHSFSFGPRGGGKVGWLGKGETKAAYNAGAIMKDGSKNARPGTPDYAIRELVRAFKLDISLSTAQQLAKAVIAARDEVWSGETEYHAFLNDTCAETAKEILDEANIATPDGDGWVKHSGIIDLPLAYAVNPYKWHRNFRLAHRERKYFPDSGEWIIMAGAPDPIFGTVLPA
jgi:hypothetical protein